MKCSRTEIKQIIVLPSALKEEMICQKLISFWMYGFMVHQQSRTREHGYNVHISNRREYHLN